MTNLFMKVNKDLFKLKLNPTEILLMAQIMEFQTNTGDCFISDKVLAENFGVSESTISRSLKALEAKGLITRSTKNTNSGKERHLVVNLEEIEKQLATSKMPVAQSLPSVNLTFAQESNCLLRNKQNDLIKDNIIDKEKDNMVLEETAVPAVSSKTQLPPGVEQNRQGMIRVSKKWLEENGIEYELVLGNWGYITATNARIEVVE